MHRFPIACVFAGYFLTPGKKGHCSVGINYGWPLRRKVAAGDRAGGRRAPQNAQKPLILTAFIILHFGLILNDFLQNIDDYFEIIRPEKTFECFSVGPIQTLKEIV